MRVVPWILVSVLASCGRNGNEMHGSVKPTAHLAVNFGSQPAKEIQGVVSTDSSAERLLVQVVDADVTVFLSLAVPFEDQIPIGDPRLVTVWAKSATEVPIIATLGSVAPQRLKDTVGFAIDAAKPSDGTSAGISISGNIIGIAR